MISLNVILISTKFLKAGKKASKHHCELSTKKASELQKELKENEESTIVDVSGNYVQNDGNLLLHRAAGILRASMINIDDMNNEYVGSDGIKIEECRNFVLDVLLDFITWCTSWKDYENAISSSDVNADKKQPDLKVLSICHGIIAYSKMVKTSLQLGLAIKIYNNFGSKSSQNYFTTWVMQYHMMKCDSLLHQLQ